MKQNEAGKETKRKVAGWSKQMLVEVASSQECEDTKEIVPAMKVLTGCGRSCAAQWWRKS